MQESYRYWAFISYSHDDRGWARWLHRKLEVYRVPRRLVGRAHLAGVVPRRLYPIFRDRDELPSSADLGSVVHRALHESRFLIVICSNRSAGSRWVNQEVETFKKLGREDRVLCIKIGDSGAGCFAPALLQHYDEHGHATGRATEPLAADATPGADGRDGAALKLIAGMLGVGYDELRRRERRRRVVQHVAAACAAGALLMLVITGWRWHQAEKGRALAAQALKVRVGQLYEAGRSELLAHNEIRAAVLLSEAYRLGMRTPAMRLMLGRAMRIADAEQVRIPTHSPVSIVDIDRDDRNVMSLDAEHRLRVFDVASGAQRFKVDLGPTEGFWAAYTESGRLIWVDTDHAQAPYRQLRLYDADTGALRARYEPLPNENGVTSLPVDSTDQRVAFVALDHSVTLTTIGGTPQRIDGHFSTTGFCRGTRELLTGRTDGMIERRDPRSAAVRARYPGLHSEPTMLASTENCELIAAGTMTGVVRVWNAATGEVLMSGGHTQPVIDLHFNGDGRRLMSLTRSAVAIWNGRSGGLIYASRFLDPNGNLANMRPDGVELGRLADGRLSVLGPLSGLDLFSLGGHNGTPIVFAFDQSGRHLVSGAGDGEIIVWNLPERGLVRIESSEPGDSGAPFAFAPDGRQVFVPELHGGGALRSLSDLQLRREIAGPPAPLGSVAYRPDGRELAIASEDGSIAVASLDEGGATRTIHTGGPPARLMAYDPSGRYLVASPAKSAAPLQLFDLQDGDALTQFERDQNTAFAMAPHASQLAIGAHGDVRIWDLQQRRWRWHVSLPKGYYDHAVNLLKYSPDGRYLLATALRQDAYLLDAGTGRIVRHIKVSASALFNVATFTSDGTEIVLGDWAKCALLWRFADDRVRMLLGHTAPVRTASFSSDDALVLTAGEDGVIKLWDRANGELLDTFTAHDGAIVWNRAHFTPDDQAIISSGADGFTRLWQIPRETRAPAVLTAQLACHAPWKIDGSVLVPTRVDIEACRKTTH